MTMIKLGLGIAIAYVVVVAGFETWLGYSQPSGKSTLVITTEDSSGTQGDRVLSRLDSQDKIYVSANHWPRRWYRQAMRRPNVEIDTGDGKRPYVAVPVIGDEHDRLLSEHPHTLGFRLLTGFPPRFFVRLEPLPATEHD